MDDRCEKHYIHATERDVYQLYFLRVAEIRTFVAEVVAIC